MPEVLPLVPAFCDFGGAFSRFDAEEIVPPVLSPAIFGATPFSGALLLEGAPVVYLGPLTLPAFSTMPFSGCSIAEDAPGTPTHGVTVRTVTITTVPTAIHGSAPIAANRVVLRNESAKDIVLCTEAGALGITLEPGDTWEYGPLPGTIRFVVEIWAVVAAGTAVLTVEETRFPDPVEEPGLFWRRPSYLVAREIGVGGSTALTHSANPSPVAPLRLPTPLPPPVYVLDENRVPIALLDGYRFFSWTRRFRGADDWTITIPKAIANATTLLTGTFVAVPIAGALRVGEIEDRGAGLDEDAASEYVEASGRCYGKWFSERHCLAGTDEGDGYDSWRTSSGSAAEAMVHFVDVNCITSEGLTRRTPARMVPDLAIGTYPATDARVGIGGRFQPVADVLSEIGAAAGLGWEVVYSTERKRFEFNVLAGRPRLEVLLSPALGNVRTVRYAASTRADRTVGVLAGMGEGAERQVAMSCTAARYPAGVKQPSGRTWREVFIDARDCTTNTDLSDRLDAKLAEYGDGTEQSFEFEILGNGPNAPEDLRPGDVVLAEYPDVAAQEARVVALTESWDEDGHHLGVEVGKEAPDLIRTIGLANRRLAGPTRM